MAVPALAQHLTCLRIVGTACRILMGLVLAVAVPSTGMAQEFDCGLPDASRQMSIPNPSCDQQRQYSLFQQLGLPYLKQMREMVVAKELRTLGDQDVMAQAASLADLYLHIYRAPSLAREATYLQVPFVEVLFNMPNIDPRVEPFRRLIDSYIETHATQNKQGMSEAVSRIKPLPQPALLANDFIALMGHQSTIQERNTLSVVQSYLAHYYRDGAQSEHVAKAYNATPDTLLTSILDTIARAENLQPYDKYKAATLIDQMIYTMSDWTALYWRQTRREGKNP